MSIKTLQCIVFLLLCFMKPVHAQQLKAVGNERVSEKVIQEYMDFVGDQAVLFNGKTELLYNLNLTNHPYLITSEYTSGELKHNNVYYKNIMLRYDLYADELIALMPEKPYNIVLEKEKVEEAYLNGYHIVRYDKDKWPDIPRCNYMIFLYDGKYPVIRRNQVTLDQKIENQRVEYTFRIKERFYVRKDNVYHQVSSKGSLLKLFPDRKKELNAYIKQHKLNFRKDREQSIKAVVEYYERFK